MSTHPSFLQRDCAALTGAPPHCDECAVRPGTPPMPRELMERAVAPRRSWWPQLSVAVAAMSVLVLVVMVRPMTTPKNGGSVSVYVKRGVETMLWNGEQHVRLGDRVQLVIEPNGMHRVTVLDGEGKQLYAGILADGPTSLPLSWRIEGPGTDERLVVILSDPGSERIELVLPKDSL